MTNARGAATGALRTTLRSKRPSDWLAVALVLALVAGGTVVTGWAVRYGVLINRLTQGVGDLVFHGGDGRPWFRMNEGRRDVPLERISPHLRHAVIAVEDQRFRYHPGIDPIGLARAAVNNLRAGARREGGSTITQQLARTLYLSNARTWGRKGKEAVLALMLELRLTKDQILELYLNRVYLSAGIYGVEAMAAALFDKPAAQLSVAESALIAGLVQAPSALSPWSNLDGARTRSAVVLQRMHAQGYITGQELEAARRQRLRVRPHPGIADAKGGYAKEYLRQAFRQQFGGDHPPDWQVHTTVRPAVQEAAERAVADGLRRLGRRDLQAALVALDPATGDLLAIVGGRDYRATPFNRAWRSRRQPGSAFKPFVFAAALSRGLSPVSTITGLSSIAVAGVEEWNPRNATEEAAEAMTLREALAESNNRAAVALQQEVGTRPVLRLASDAGLSDQPNVPSLALGSGLVTPLALTAAYAAFPNGGYVVRPRGIRRVLDQQGGVAYEQPVDRAPVLSPEVAYQMVSLMQDVIDHGTGTAVRAAGIRFPVGGKTGTTNDFKDAWFVGFSSAVVVGVWVGFDQPATIAPNGFGSRVALPIWADFVRRTAKLLPPGEFPRPPGLRDEELCRVTYHRPVDGCPTYVEYFKADDQVPGRLCELHKGSLKQRARRAVEGFFVGLGRRLRDMFR